MAKKSVSNSELAYIFLERLKTFDDCSPRISIAIVPTKSGWTAVTNGWANFRKPACVRRIRYVQNQLRAIYALAKD
jgi:hypothetical protein